MRGWITVTTLWIGAALATAPASAQTRLVLKSANSSSSYYVMIVQIGEAVREATGGGIAATVEESQGSIQNLKEAVRRPGNFVFTTPPSLLEDARQARKPFENDKGFEGVRALFPMPGVTIHIVTRADAGITKLADLAGRDLIPGGRGTFCDGRTRALLGALGLDKSIRFIDVEAANAENALRNRQVGAFTNCSSHPSPNIQELAVGTPIRLISLSPADVAKISESDPLSSPVTIAANTYQGVPEPVSTVGMAVGAYGTDKMDEATAYAVTKAFWDRREEMARRNPWWAAVTLDQIAGLRATVHPGALRYYREKGVTGLGN